MNERELAANVETLCKYLRVRYYHTWNSRHSTPGFPDYVFVTRDNRLLFRELKAEHGRMSVAQDAWLTALVQTGASVGVWWPRDWFNGVIKAELSPQPIGEKTA